MNQRGILSGAVGNWSAKWLRPWSVNVPRPKSDDKLVPVMVRMASGELAVIDRRRGERSRSDYVRSVLFPAPLAGQPEKAPKRHADDCRCLSCAPPKEAKG